MGEVNYYLNKTGKKGKAHIYLRYLYNGRQLKFSFGQSVKPADWNPKKQRVKSNNETTEDGKRSLNNLLDELAKECERAYNDALVDGIPAPETLRERLQQFIDRNDKDETTVDRPSLYKLIERFTNGEIKHKGQDKSLNTIKTYNTTYHHLQAFQKTEPEYSKGISFEHITLDFYYKFVSYLKAEGLGANAIGKNIQVLKVFMSEAVDLNYTTNMQFRHRKFAVARIDTDAVYLSEKELIDLYRFDLSKQKRLERVRDLFVFGSFVGLRFGDYSTIKPENIVQIDGEYFIKMITQKTGDLVIIPCNPIVLDIFRKYADSPNKLPKAPSNQKFNDYIKQACKEAGLTETGRLATDPGLELWQCVSSHTCRRSFATNLYLDGFPTIDLMKITSHKTERAFLKYIRVTKLHSAKRLNEHIKRMWSAKLLKAAS